MLSMFEKVDVFFFLQRDRDLELAARIGQALLKRNHILTEQNEGLEEQLTQALDHVSSFSKHVMCRSFVAFFFTEQELYIFQ